MPGEQHDIQHCRWAGQTMLLADPFWMSPSEFPWSCYRDGEPRPIDDTRECHVCARWEPRDETEQDTPPW
jgi:hypothetical protein